MTRVDRRAFIHRSAGIAGAALIPASLSGLLAACTESDPTGVLVPRTSRLPTAGLGHGGYGPLTNNAGVLLLPEDFRLTTFGTVGELMSDGNVTTEWLRSHRAGDAFVWFETMKTGIPPDPPSRPSTRTTPWPAAERPRSSWTSPSSGGMPGATGAIPASPW